MMERDLCENTLSWLISRRALILMCTKGIANALRFALEVSFVKKKKHTGALPPAQDTSKRSEIQRRWFDSELTLFKTECSCLLSEVNSFYAFGLQCRLHINSARGGGFYEFRWMLLCWNFNVFNLLKYTMHLVYFIYLFFNVITLFSKITSWAVLVAAPEMFASGGQCEIMTHVEWQYVDTRYVYMSVFNIILIVGVACIYYMFSVAVFPWQLFSKQKQ